jgi:hypothetical protein
MKFTLEQPVQVGDLMNPIVIDAMELASISLNFEPERSSKGTAILSVVLAHRASGYKINVVYDDATALDFWRQIEQEEEVISRQVLSKLINDGKLPAGTLA